MTDMLRLHYAPDNASLIIRLALEELGCAYETTLVDRRQNAQHSPAYLALNPNGQIPVLETPQGVLYETAAILLWLSETYGGLAPKHNAAERGRVLTWLFWLSNSLHLDLRMLFHPETYAGQDAAACKAFTAQTASRAQARLALFDAALAAEPYLSGSQTQDGTATIFDLYLPCLIRWAALYGNRATAAPWFDLRQYPNIHTLCLWAEARPSAAAAQAAEGLGATPFTAPTLARPPEGFAT